MSRIVVVMLGILCMVVAAVGFGIVRVAEQLSADLHRSAIALDALVARVAAVEEDLANIADDVYSIADDVAAISDRLALEPDGEGNEGEYVTLRSATVPGGERAVAGRVGRRWTRAARRAHAPRVSVRRPDRGAQAAGAIPALYY